MARFEVVIERTIRRTVTVDAVSNAAARKEIVNYGDHEAWNDYQCVAESDTTRIVAVKKAG